MTLKFNRIENGHYETEDKLFEIYAYGDQETSNFSCWYIDVNRMQSVQVYTLNEGKRMLRAYAEDNENLDLYDFVYKKRFGRLQDKPYGGKYETKCTLTYYIKGDGNGNLTSKRIFGDKEAKFQCLPTYERIGGKKRRYVYRVSFRCHNRDGALIRYNIRLETPTYIDILNSPKFYKLDITPIEFNYYRGEKAIFGQNLIKQLQAANLIE